MTLSTPLGDFGAPPDAVAWGALMLALVAILGTRARNKWQFDLPDKAIVGAAAVFALAASALYVRVYLRGGPRIIDATTYYLQARAFAAGHVTFPVPSPTASFRGRFLLASPDGHSLAGIFPPGYPALLALGFVAAMPLAMGPVLAAGLVVVTHALALRLFGSRPVAILAAALSATCAVLRYHTADTMSHGLSALLLAATVWAATMRSGRGAVVAGLCAGWLVATRPVTGAVGFALAAVALREPRLVAVLVAASAPPIALVVLEQRAATGAWLTSSQTAYYALADGPPGCFRYGFGRGIGCVFEHGDFVRAHLGSGYGLVAALGTTLRRLKMHLADAANIELSAPLVACALVRAWRDRVRLPALAVIGVVVAYAPFYFDGNYPGGGARFYADVLPFEHVLLAYLLVKWQVERFALPVALAGFAFHTAYDHVRLAEREGGRPMFEPDVLRRAGIARGLVFVDTDHGFDLGFNPSARDASTELVVARRRDDAHDVALWERLGKPAAFHYELLLSPHAPPPELVPLSFDRTSSVRFESESEWPPLSVEGGYTAPEYPACASSHRALALRPQPGQALRVRLGSPVLARGKYRLRTGWVTPGSRTVEAIVTFSVTSWSVHLKSAPGTCVVDEGPPLTVTHPSEIIDISVNSPASLDYVEALPETGSLEPE